ncbi:putative coiled-coil domain-containing protein [Apostichopus japonicus]|uniref:Putative coiled-coil domain-containing protein n=1 Tax=Stichopus japonicus TaxID=307972 RepID=A0A2G8JDR6_STIJA|nr:putative coiled-coil domain-containing protein [Apostichopus japonicus]
MPKKFPTENTKAVQARARKADAKAAEKAKSDKEKEDAAWRDDNRQLAKKQQRKTDKEKKRLEDLARKNENKKLLEEEEEIIKGKPVKPSKLTRAQVVANQIAAQKAEAEARKKNTPTHLDVQLEENVNIVVAQAKAEGMEEARNVEDAIAVLGVNDDAPKDMHPERRVKAAYAAFEEVNLPRLKAENPNLRLSQLKQMLRKDWMKSPENPLNQR